MDVAYPVGVKRETPDQLAWSLRSAVSHFPVDRVFLAGNLPGWVSSEVIHLPTKQDSTKHVNIGRNLEAVLDSDISDPFLWMNDDFFFLDSFGEDFPLYVREGRFDHFCSKIQQAGVRSRRARSTNLQSYINGMLDQMKLLKSLGVDVSAPINADVHVPIPIDKVRLKRVLGEVKEKMPHLHVGHFRTLYANWPPQRTDTTLIPDPKIMTNKTRLPNDRPFISTNPRSWVGVVGDELRERFPEKSRFEA